MKALLLLAGCLLAGVTTARANQPVRVEHLRFTTGADPGQPSVAVDPREGFVLTWQEREGGRASLWFAVIDRNGRELRRARIATGTNWFVNWADFPSLRVLDNADWVTHYLEKSAGSTYAYDVRLVRSTDRGKTWSTPVTPHTDGTPTQHGFVSLSPLGGDRVLVVWLDGRRGAGHAGHEDGPMTLRSAILDRSGARREERELDDSTCSCCQTDAVRIAGRTLIAYRDRSAAEVRDIAVAVRSNGGAWSKPKIINPDGWKIEACPVNGPAVASHGERVLTIWPTQAGGTSEVRFAVAQLAERGSAHALDAGLGTLGRVDAAAWRDGFLVSWLGGGRSAGRAGLQLAHIGAGGEILARQTLSNVPPTRMSGNPRLAADRDRALIAWIEPNAQKSGNALAVALLRQ